ncbi:MAG TPA: adenylate/guanylate cyclase domain-containing protein [Herpetosiphonaceae bacterium]|nr:adenylate/guanylate cyclase domain-containing protein [Herpetosiphonaceae bacterium]
MICPHCHTRNPESSRFCAQCGTLLAAASVPIIERRRVTVVFADLVGFTAFAEHTDPEQVHRVINACFDLLVPIIEHYGGTVDKFIGDEVMALFGAPIAHEDDPVRALAAAADMVAAMAGFNAAHGTDLSLHIGINTGMVIAGGIGSVGRQQYSVIGDAVNLASRLTGIATSHEVIVGAETRRMAAHAFGFAALAPVQVKGRAEPVQAYRLLARKARPESERGLAGLVSPMVGRSNELATLVSASEALLEGRGHAALLIGEAGIGKSRLLAEWRAASQELGGGIRWIEARCLSYGQEIAYHMLRDMLRSLIGVHPTSDAAATAAALAEFASELLGERAAEVHAPLRHLLLLDRPDDGERSPQAIQSQYLAALRATFQALAARQPLVYVMEDIHWADAASIDIMVKLLPLRQEAPIIFAATTRPDHDVPGWQLLLAAGQDSGNALRLDLTPLSLATSRQLVANLLRFESLPESVRGLILSRADGNPFFVEEVIRSLIEQQAIVQSGDQWIAPHPIETFDLPNNVHGLLAARVDRLDPEHKQLLRMAAVIGRRFSVPVLAAVLAEDEGLIAEQLERMAASDLLRLDQTAPERRYRFRHALVHEVVYDSTLLEERRRLHLGVGQTLERLYPARREELAATLAYHFALAESPQAVAYLLLAGDVAFRQYAVAEAVTHYRRAHERFGESALNGPALRQFYTRYGRALELHGGFDRANDLYDEMIELAEMRGDQDLRLAGLIEQARLFVTPTSVRNLSEGRELAEQALPLARRLGQAEAEARALWILALSFGFSGQPQRAVEYGELSLAIARRHNLREQMAYTLHDMHRAYRNAEQPDQATQALREATDLWRQLGNLPMLADSLASAADLVRIGGDNGNAFRIAQEAYRLSQSIGNPWNESFASAIMAEICFDWGRLSEAVYWCEQAVELSDRGGPVLLTVRARLALAEMHRLLGDTAQARVYLDHSLEKEHLLEPYFRTGFQSVVIASRIDIALSEDNRAELDRLREGFAPEQLDESQLSFLGGIYVALLQSRLAAHDGQWAQALAHADQAIAVGRKLRRRVSLAYGLHHRARALLGLGDPEAAEPSLREAVSLLQPLSAQTYLWEVYAALAEVAERRGDETAAGEWREQSLAALRFLLDHLSDSRLRASFAARPVVQKLLNAQSPELVLPDAA